MEKYRRFGDSATGINPFITKTGVGSGSGVVTASHGGIGSLNTNDTHPNIIITLLSIIIFPIKIIILFLILLLLFIFELIGYFFWILGLWGVFGEVFIFPFICLFSRIWLIISAAIVVKKRMYPIRGSRSVRMDDNNNNLNNNNNNNKDERLLDEIIGSPLPGDVIISNLVTPMDLIVVMSCGTVLPKFISDKNNNNNNLNNNNNMGSVDKYWRLSSCLCVFLGHNKNNNNNNNINNNIISFEPSPLQKWKVFCHIMYTTSKEYLTRGVSSKEGEINNNNNNNNNNIIDLTPIQKRAKALGVPILLFPEGTPSNGKGMLKCPSFIINNNNNNNNNLNNNNNNNIGRLHIISLSYDSSAPCKIIESSPSAMKNSAQFTGAGNNNLINYFFNLTRRGSATAPVVSASSPSAMYDGLISGVLSFLLFLPIICGFVNKCRVSIVRASLIPLAPVNNNNNNINEWVEEIRRVLCASVSFNNTSNNINNNNNCRPLMVGIEEKRQYQEYVENEVLQEELASANIIMGDDNNNNNNNNNNRKRVVVPMARKKKF